VSNVSVVDDEANGLVNAVPTRSASIETLQIRASKDWSRRSDCCDLTCRSDCDLGLQHIGVGVFTDYIVAIRRTHIGSPVFVGTLLM
jgi:hypothetical protein